MMRFLRSQSQTVLIIVLGVIGLGFLFYGSSGNLLTGTGGHVSNDYGRIDGTDLSVAELTEAVRTTRTAIIISGRGQQLSQPGAGNAVAEEAWRQLLLLNEADRLHIDVTNQQVIDYIRGLPVFQKDGVFQPDIYQTQMAQLQTILHGQTDSAQDPAGSTRAAFETFIRNAIRTEAVNNALFSSVRGSAQDVSAQYGKYYGSAEVSVITFDPKTFIAAVQVKPEDIEAEYKNHPENPDYRSNEKRKVDYVLFMLSPDQAKLGAPEKKAAIEALGEKALDFVLAFQPDPSATSGATPAAPDFMAEATKRGLNPVTSDYFTADMPPANVPPSPAFNNAAFALTKENPVSKVVELDNGVAVLHLDGIQPSDLLPIDKVRDVIVKQLQQSQGQVGESLAAAKAAQDLKDAVAKGTDFKAAAAALNLKVETLPAFIPIKVARTDQRLQTIAYTVTTLAPGAVSGPVPIESDNTVVILHLDARAVADPAGLAEFEGRYRQSQDQQLRDLMYTDWANWKGRQPGTHKPPDLDAYGSVE